MNLYDRGTIESFPPFTVEDMGAPTTHYVVSDPAGHEIGRVPYSWEDGADPYGSALALLGLKRPHNGSPVLAVFREGWDAYDPWGSAMMAAGDVCDLAAIVGADVPGDMGYRRAMGDTRELEDILIVGGDVSTELADLARAYRAGEIDAADIETAARILSRYLDACKRAGRDY